MVVLFGGCASHPKSGGSKAQATAKARPPIKKSTRTYRVRKGDSLYSIAWRAGLDYQTVARWNHLRSPYTIYPGQVIRLYPPHTQTAAKTQKKSGYQPRKPAPKHSVGSKTTVAAGKSPHPAKKTVKSAKPQPAKAGSLHWQWPTRGKVLSRYSSSDPSRSGIEIGGRKGQKILAAEGGEVVYVGSGLIGYGQLIIIKHNNKYLSAYGHNSSLLVKEGDRVKRGQHISNMGVTNQGKSLLYFEVRRYGKPVNPLAYLPRG
ncbi:peptidoglycan DD-metalloendopeptidase family protein [Thiolapillus sp.]